MSIELKNVTYTYSPGTAYEIHALKDVNLTIPDGQFIGIIGNTGEVRLAWCSSIRNISFSRMMCSLMSASGQ